MIHARIQRGKQAGVALAVSLFLLLVLTIIGLTAVRMTTLQGRMAANYQFQNLAFQGAESVIRRVVGEVRAEVNPPTGVTQNILISAISSTSLATAPQRNFAINTTNVNVAANAVVTYQGQSRADGYSMRAGEGIVAHRFQITANSAVPNVNVQAEHQQGISRIGPGF
ncbi:MAG TPA: PilX N-terminal domain-containing pilus assembly protein [Solimonas sp.]